MALRERQVQHLLRRAGFGASREEVDFFAELGIPAAIERLLNYEQAPDDALTHMGQAGYARLPTTFTPATNIGHARLRWLFRMIYSPQPLREKMTLFLHDQLATSYNKIADDYGSTTATRMMAAMPASDPGGKRGHIELIRDYALGSYRDLLIEIARDPAMLVWLDGETNKKGKPQENFAREIMELFTIGRLNHTEQDVYEGARVFTGWNLKVTGMSSDVARPFDFFYDANQHDTGPKTFTFPIYPDGTTTIPARAAADGMQDGIDFINALARHPATGVRLAKRMWYFFVSEAVGPTPEFEQRVSGAYYSSGYNMRAMLLKVLTSPEFWDPTNFHSRYSWPTEYVVRALKEVGASDYNLSDVLGYMDQMSQTLYAPPSVGGWLTGSGWFSTGAMIARMNFAASLTRAQRVVLREAAKPSAGTPQRLLSHALDRLTACDYEGPPLRQLLTYLGTGANWNGTDTELGNKTAGVVHLILGSPEYQLV